MMCTMLNQTCTVVHRVNSNFEMLSVLGGGMISVVPKSLSLDISRKGALRRSQKGKKG